MPPHTDQARDTAGFTQLMRAYQDMVYSIAARITASDSAGEDIAQAVFLKAYEHYPRIRDNPAVGGWLKTTAIRLSLNHLERYRRRWRLFSELRREAAAEDDDPPEVDFPAPEFLPEDLDAPQRAAAIERALAGLPDHQRVPLVLYHFHDMDYAAIARELGISPGKLKTDLHRGRRALALRLGAEGITA